MHHYKIGALWQILMTGALLQVETVNILDFLFLTIVSFYQALSDNLKTYIY